jgi:hypothetical protein
MVRLIGKNNPNRWFYAKIVGTGEDSLKVFGYVGPLGKTALETGLPILVTFLTEEELQIAVDNIAGTDNYYQNQIEIDSSKFTGESGIYIRGLLVREEE